MSKGGAGTQRRVLGSQGVSCPVTCLCPMYTLCTTHTSTQTCTHTTVMSCYVMSPPTSSLPPPLPPSPPFTPASIPSVIEKLRGELVSMKKAASSEEAFKTSISTMLKYIGNVARSPDEDKFRSINVENAAFQSRVAAVQGSIDFLKHVGFQVGACMVVLFCVHGV